MRRDGPLDHGLSVITLVLLSTPDFLLGTLLLIGFVIRVPLFPAMSLVDQAPASRNICAPLPCPR